MCAACITAQASGCRLGRRPRALGAFLRVGGLQGRTVAPDVAQQKWGRDPRFVGPAPAARGPAAAAPSSALRWPACRAPSAFLRDSLAPSPRAGSALTPPHAATAAGRWRGTTAARCWTRSSPPSSSTISPTRRYGRRGTTGPGLGVPSCGGCRRSPGDRQATVGALGGEIGGFQAAELPLFFFSP